MMFRPRESHDLRLIRTGLSITPPPRQLRWLHDPFDNSVAIAEFEGSTHELRFESTVTLEHFESTLPDYPLESSAKTYPFQYSQQELQALTQGLSNHYPSDQTRPRALQFLDDSPTTDTMKILLTMTQRIRDEFAYTQRWEEGVQTPDETLNNRTGSCRDFAVLMMEAVRCLGIAARFVSGYIFVPDEAYGQGGGATHAWMQAYLPGAGWIDFDPTNSIAGNRDLIRRSGMDT